MAKVATVTTAKNTEPTAPLRMTIRFEAFEIKSDVWPSTLVQTSDDKMSPEDVLEMLQEDYLIHTIRGMMAFVDDQNWVEVADGDWEASIELVEKA